ncbi:hypothetical protein MJO28_013438 [Puccinia striiformis f. sp. tritici]|uniref:Uncharacterized protein n=1 Tax=Puccinia striiformis f. sp. tritici TaxID=168172 RepID=A0ACC0E072_9BASI|nr:hypothetical protein MJO28_013438 [Puccinia striiformis f. sp. tritici]
MFERAIQLRRSCDHYCEENTETRPYLLSPSKWDQAENVMNLLKPLSKATTLLCGSDYPTINKALPIYIVLMKHLKRIEHGLYDQSQLIQPATQIITKLEQYLLAALTKPVYICAMILDPVGIPIQEPQIQFTKYDHCDNQTQTIKSQVATRENNEEHHRLSFADSSPGEDPDLNEQNQPKGDIDCIQRRETESSQVGKLRSNHWFIYNPTFKTQICKKNEAFLQEYYEPSVNTILVTFREAARQFEPKDTTTQPTSSTSQTSSRIAKKPSFFSSELYESVAVRNTVEAEIDRYLKEDLEPEETDALHYWAVRQKNHPVLSKMAPRFLAVLATSAASEQVFSKGRQIVSWQRSSLDPGTIEQLLCLKEWYQLIISPL